ncbi:cysteine desulfurase [Marinobacterium zhoushanense]|uniref:Probable cysteine desulfurase n=1 Tax=Marinobacterium zhoushanense TaxID=1679163 RepID=A0ABQ1KT81_9GAMM|nr:cysteine desulfurase [Marinobacterium zhoushanense]GGC05931.1 cysteine desulfurase [Marinobacterium zhoushanense]
MNESMLFTDADNLALAKRCRGDFPLLSRQMHGRPLVYLDNAATSQKPQAVLDALQYYYQQQNANVHRGVYQLSEEATSAYEGARARVQRFINAAGVEEIIFLRGTTEAINLVAQAYARPRLQPGDEVLISAIEHHSNIVPWQIVCRQTGAQLRVIPVLDSGELDQAGFAELLSPRVRLLALTHVSNALGTINPVKEMIAQAHQQGIPVLIDGAQAVPHLRVDVQALDADFYAFSGHKLYGPTGIGALYGKRRLLEDMEPWQGGGEMIIQVSFEHTDYNQLPYKFEAGTPNIADAIGLAAALDYVDNLGLEAIAEQEQQLLDYGTQALQRVPGLRLIGTAQHKAAILSFVMEQAHPHDISTILDRCGVAVRAGHHCAMPLMQRFGIAGTARASLALYNTRDDIDVLVDALHEVVRMFGAPMAEGGQ